MVNEHHILGEPNTGFERYDNKGPFECGNCKYFKNGLGPLGTCNQIEMVIYSRQPRVDKDAVLVAVQDCCEYVDRVGSKPTPPEL